MHSQRLLSIKHEALVHVSDLLQVNGVPFIIDGRACHFRGTVTVVSADNPASAALGGFKQSSSAFRFCRHCMGTEDVQTKVCMWLSDIYILVVLCYI